MRLPHLHLFALSNVLFSVSRRWQPDITEGHLAFWLPTKTQYTLIKKIINVTARLSFAFGFDKLTRRGNRSLLVLKGNGERVIVDVFDKALQNRHKNIKKNLNLSESLCC